MRAALPAMLVALPVSAGGSLRRAVSVELNETGPSSSWAILEQHVRAIRPNSTGTGAHCEPYFLDLPPCGLQPEGHSCSPTFHSVLTNLAINFLTFSGMLLAFVVLHFSPTWARVLSPLRGTLSQCCSISSLPFLCWKDDGSKDRVSIDGWVMIRFCRVGFRYSVLGTAIGCVLVPMYAEGDRLEKSHFQRYTISNLDDQEWKVWFIVASTYVLTICFCLAMLLEWRNYVTMRRDHFLARARGDLGLEAAQAQFSLMVERVPPVHQSNQGLQEAFKRVFNSVHSAVLLPDTAHKYDKLLLRKGLCVCSCCACGRQNYEQGVDHLMRLNRSTRQGMRLAHSVFVELRAPGGSTSTGFVTLDSVADQQIALQQVSLFHSRSLDTISYADYVVVPAPEARDIIWRNAGMSHAGVTWRSKLGKFVCFVGVLLWSVPLLSVRTFTSTNFILTYFPSAAETLKKVSFLYSLFLEEGYLSVVAIQTLLLSLPYMLEALSLGLEGRKQKSTIARKVLIRNLYFQLASLYFMVIGGVLSKDLITLVTSMPFPCLAEKFGQSVPQVAVYFLNFVMARAGLSLPFLLLRPYALFCGFKYMWKKEEYKEPIYCWFGYEATNLVIVLVVANMYAIIAPLITVLCVVYFALASCVYNYLFRYVYSPEFDCQGRFWEELFQGAMAGLWLGTLTVTGVVTLYSSTSHAFYAMGVLLLLIMVFSRQAIAFYQRRSKHMPFEDAISVDRTVGPELVRKFKDSYYLDPIEKLELPADDPASRECDSTDPEESSAHNSDSSDSTVAAERAESSSIEAEEGGATDSEEPRNAVDKSKDSLACDFI